jgi:hypothetical protein
MKNFKEYANIYLVVGILSLFVLFSIVTFYFMSTHINNNSSATIYEKTLQKNIK